MSKENIDKKKKQAKEASSKDWTVGGLDGGELNIRPIFEVNEEDENVEARYLEMYLKKNGEEMRMAFNYLDIFMFMYFCANEELRRTLSMREEATRAVNYIPYEVSFKLDDKERKKGLVKRQIQVPLDALQVAIAKNEVLKNRFGKRISKGKNKRTARNILNKDWNQK